MNGNRESVEIGEHFGMEAANHIARRAEDYCECERRRIELTNQPRILALHFEGSRLAKKEKELEERLRLAPPPGDSPSRRRKAVYHWVVGITLTLAALIFVLIAFDPFRFGWKAEVYGLGIALVTPFAVETFLEAWNRENVLKAAVTVVFLCALGGGALLAIIRGDLFSRQINQQNAPAIVIDGEGPAAPQSGGSFYDSTRTPLRFMMLLLALAIDLGAGIAIHRALQSADSSAEDYEGLSRELMDVRQHLAGVVHEISELTNAPDSFVARFWRDFYRAMITETVRNGIAKFLALSLCLVLFGSSRAAAQSQMNLVIAVDLTASVAAKGHDGQSQFAKNIQGIRRLLTSVPANSKITVVGITENSFSDPYILLSAELSEDPGYFGERLESARQQLVRAWDQRCSHLKPTARNTDIFGALLLASLIFHSSKEVRKNVLVIFSDMRHATRELNLETLGTIRTDAALAVAERNGFIADLSGVSVAVLGVDGAGRDLGYWSSVKKFWVEYFARSRARLEDYSVVPELPGYFHPQP